MCDATPRTTLRAGYQKFVDEGRGVVPIFSFAARASAAVLSEFALFVPERDRLVVAARAGLLGLGSDAAILVFRPQH
jgi:hypothetical protein